MKPYEIDQVHGRPHHPQTQGKIERYHRSMKSIVKLDTYFLPSMLEQSIADFVAYYNYKRYHESLDNVTPADVFFGRYEEVLSQREIVKQQTLLERGVVKSGGAQHPNELNFRVDETAKGKTQVGCHAAYQHRGS